jgi:hypothetical protein
MHAPHRARTKIDSARQEPWAKEGKYKGGGEFPESVSTLEFRMQRSFGA